MSAGRGSPSASPTGSTRLICAPMIGWSSLCAEAGRFLEVGDDLLTAWQASVWPGGVWQGAVRRGVLSHGGVGTGSAWYGAVGFGQVGIGRARRGLARWA